MVPKFASHSQIPLGHFFRCCRFSSKAFENIVLAALFADPSVPDFDIFFEDIENQLSGSDNVEYKRKDIVVRLQSILLDCGLNGTTKIFKMKQCNGFIVVTCALGVEFK